MKKAWWFWLIFSVPAKLRSIVKGWWYYLIQNSEHVERVAKHRAHICSQCPHAVDSLFDFMHDDRNPKISGKECELCGCPLPTKIRSLFEECAAEPPKWERVD